MVYRLYIYNTEATTGSAYAVSIINEAVSGYSQNLWKEHDAARCMSHFRAEEVKKEIETELGEACKVFIRFPPCGFEQVEYLSVVTSYARAKEILPGLHAVAMKNRLALYDVETKRVFFKDSYNDAFITLRIREQELKHCILKGSAPIWRIRKIYDYKNEESCYSVTLEKDSKKNFLERVSDFYECLNRNLTKDETLVSKDRSFTVYGNWYSITYVLEGYKKHAGTVGFYENGWARHCFSRRMSVENAFKWMKECGENEKTPLWHG